MKSWMTRLSGAAVLAALAAGAALADASALEKFPGAKDAIMSYYAANARERGNCGAGQMQDIGNASVVSESGDQAVVARRRTPSAPRPGPAAPQPAAATTRASSPSPRVARAGASAA